ncbi:hypothetical protein ES705_46908 [subsurface metagenome]
MTPHAVFKKLDLIDLLYIILSRMHLKNLVRILKYTLKEISAENIIDILYKKTKCIIEKHIIQRDAENFIAYLKFLIFSTHGKKAIKVKYKIVTDFIDRVYSECDHKTRYFKSENLSNYFENKLGNNIVLNNTELGVIFQKLRRDKQSSMERVMMRVCAALVLKWLQGSLQNKLSESLNKYIGFLASVYGLYGTNRVFNVDWQPYEISQNDAALINSEYKFFETTIINAIGCVNKASLKSSFSNKYKDQFQVVLSSIDNLIRMSELKQLDSAEAFTNKIIIAATLIYLQDEYVEKTPDLEKFINLFVSFYYQFRDKRYIPVFTNTSSISRFS